jgi:phosphoribosylformylglycinamidine cyclo-ligase
VDEEREQSAFREVMQPWIERFSAESNQIEFLSGLKSGFYATVLRLRSGSMLAMTTDGVGTKILIAREAQRYESVGIDCVANNVNDLICTGAEPLILLDYIATDRIEEHVMEELARGLYLGAELANVTIAGGEIAQVGAMLAPAEGGSPMFDLVGSALGAFPLSEQGTMRDVVDGSKVEPGDVIVGLPSSGLHSNGYSLARRALFEIGEATLDAIVPGSNETVVNELLEPTRIYVAAVSALWQHGIEPHGLVNISGGGLLNLGRMAADVCYTLDSLPVEPPIYSLIRDSGGIGLPVMYATFNMGVGFCVVVSEKQANRTLAILQDAGEDASVLGKVVNRPGKEVWIPALSLLGQGERFELST